MRRSNRASSPLSASAPESGRIDAAYVAADGHSSTITSPPSNFSNHRHHHGGIARASSAAVHTGKEKFGKRSRSALGLSSRSSSVSSDHARAHAYDHAPLHPAYEPQTQETPRSTTSSASSSTSSSRLSVHGDEALVLAADRRDLLVDFVDRSVDDAYNLCHGFGSIRWHPTKNREGVSIYRAKSGELVDDPRLDASVRGKCMVSASFDEMMDTLITETTSDFVSHESSVNPSEFLDGQVLATLVPRTRSDRFACIKWHCIKSHAPSVTKHRDYIYVEVVDQFTDRDGRRVGFRLSKSVDLDELHTFDHSAIFVRGKTLTLHTFSQASPGTLELYTMMINDLGERLPAWLVQKIIDTAAMRSACLRDHINQKRMDLLVLARPKEMVPLHKRVCCVVCTRSFSLVRKKYNCVACGDVICNQCSVHQFVAPPTGTISDFVGKKKARICVKCSTNAKRRELPKRRSSNAACRERPSATLDEMDHRRGSGSTIIATSSSSSSLSSSSSSSSSRASHYHRLMRSASAMDVSSSVDSGGTYSEESGRVHPSGERASSGARPTIPHMFNHFRPVVKPSTSSSSSVGRSSVLSNSRTSSSSPEDEAMLRQESMSGAHDDDHSHDNEHEHDGHNDADAGHDQTPHTGSENEMDFDNLLDESALDRSGCDAETDAAMAEYRKTLVSGAPTHNADDDDELTDADDDDETFQSNSSSNSNISTLASSSGSSASATTIHVEEEAELIIEEVCPQDAFRSSSTHTTPRPSVVVEEPQVMKVVKPVVIKQHTKKRFGVGGSSRAKAVSIEPATTAKSTAAAPPPPSPPSPPPQANPLRESIVVRSRRATLVDDKPPTEGEVAVDELEVQEAIQLADLQMHLDRMTMISESLKSLQRQQSKHNAAAEKQTLAAQLASMSKIEKRAQQEAAIAAGFVQALLEETSVRSSEKGSGRSTKGSEFPLTASFVESDDEETRMMEMSLEGDVHLVREDGSFSDFLADSSFSEISSTYTEGPPSQEVHGWVAVHSMTTGKTYYYNESCGTTSWTMPTPDTDRKKFGTYMVL